jgi:hypothetical protein
MVEGGRFSCLALATGLLLAGPLAGTLVAQRNQPIYPAYDGYIKNDDGSFTIAYAYFSHNAEVVTIAPGADNQFSPGAPDRQHPTTFHPGHNRFQCVMVVGPDFDGKLLWNLTYAGVTTSTSQQMLQSNWYLVEGGPQLKAIEFAKVPRGVCLNQAPAVRILGLSRGRGGPPTLSTGLNEPLSLFGSVHDEGLPRSGTLTVAWKQIEGPGAANFENAASARTRVRFDRPGTYLLELTGSDAELTRTTRVSVAVAASTK